MKKILATILALSLIFGFSIASAEFNTIEDGKCIYATCPDFPPFESLDDNENVIGIEPDIMSIICGDLGLVAEPYIIDFDSALMAPSSGKADVVVSGVGIREDRKASLDFTIPFITIVQGVVFKVGNDVTLDNLKDKTIGVQSGTTGQIQAVDNFGESHVVAYDKYPLVFQALQNGQVDCVMVDDMVGAAYVKQLPGLVMIQTEYEREEIGFGFAKGNADLVETFNMELQKLLDDGTIAHIVEKWNE